MRTARPGLRRLDDEMTWIARYQAMLNARLDRLGALLDRTQGEET